MSIPLGGYSSIYQAETVAIIQCCQKITETTPTEEEITVCSDSQSVLTALKEVQNKVNTDSKLLDGLG